MPLYVTEMEDIRTLKAVFLNELQVKKSVVVVLLQIYKDREKRQLAQTGINR